MPPELLSLILSAVDAWLSHADGFAPALPALVAAGLPALVPREVLFGNPTRLAPRLSPDGKNLAYLAPDEGVMNVWVKTMGAEDDRVVTSDRGRGIQEYFWAQDGRHLVYVQDRDGDENWHLWSASLDRPGQYRDLTPYPGVQAAALEVHPDHPHQFLAVMNLRDRRLRDVYRIDVQTGAVEPDTENPGATIGWYADPEFRIRGRLDTTPDGGTALYLRDDAESPWREAARWPLEEIGSGIGFTPDGRGFYLIDSRGRDTSALLRLDVSSGRTELVAHDETHDLTGAVVHPRTHEVQVVTWDKDRRHHRPIDPGIDRAWRAAEGLDDGDMQLASRDLDDRTWIVAFVQDDGPVRYHAFDVRERKGRFLFAHRDDLDRWSLSKMEPIRFESGDGLALHGYLTLPEGLEPASLPLVVHPHGGPWVRDTWGFDPTVQWLANRGYAVLQVNFRGSTGYGKTFLHAGDKEWGRKMQSDLSDGVSWAVEKGIADPGRVAIMGGSYGGYAALAGIAFTPDLYAAAVDIVGPSSLFTLIASIPPYWEPLRRQMHMQVGDPETEADLLRERSPLFHVDAIKTPLLIGQGANDPRVKQQESEQIVSAMRSRGKEVRYVLFPDEGHGFARPENRLQFYGIAEEFLARHLGGRNEPLDADGHGGSGIEP